jgi:peptidoglycan/LPS O-acetylase OafA/YrhL
VRTRTGRRAGARAPEKRFLINSSLYLAHLPVLRLTTYFLKTATWHAQYGIYLFLTFVVSIVVYTLYERRMTQTRERFGKKSEVEL